MLNMDVQEPPKRRNYKTTRPKKEDMNTWRNFAGQSKSRNMRNQRSNVLDNMIQVGAGKRISWRHSFYFTMKDRNCLGGIVGAEDITSTA